MNQKRLLALFLCLIVIVSSRFTMKKKYDEVKVKSVNLSTDRYSIDNIYEDTENLKINIFYPVTKFEKVNNYIISNIKTIKEEFLNMSYIDDKKTLEIKFDEHVYDEYTSYRFYINIDIGMNHPLGKIITVSHKEDKIIDLAYLRKLNPSLMEIIRENVYKQLINNEKIKEYSNEEWLKNGVDSLEENNINFLFTQNGFIIVINPYIVGPYVAGVFNIEISYEELNF